MVIIKGEIKTSEIMSCGYNRNTQKWDVKFNIASLSFVEKDVRCILPIKNMKEPFTEYGQERK